MSKPHVYVNDRTKDSGGVYLDYENTTVRFAHDREQMIDASSAKGPRGESYVMLTALGMFNRLEIIPRGSSEILIRVVDGSKCWGEEKPGKRRKAK